MRRDLCVETEAVKACRGENSAVVLAGLYLGHARVDVAADLFEPQVGPQRAQLRPSPRRAGSNLRTRRQFSERNAIALHPGVARIASLEKSRQGESWGHDGGNVFQTVHREI